MTAMAYINHQGGASSLAMVERILSWTKVHIVASFAVYIPGVDNAPIDRSATPGFRGMDPTPRSFPELVSRLGDDAYGFHHFLLSHTLLDP